MGDKKKLRTKFVGKEKEVYDLHLQGMKFAEIDRRLQLTNGTATRLYSRASRVLDCQRMAEERSHRVDKPSSLELQCVKTQSFVITMEFVLKNELPVDGGYAKRVFESALKSIKSGDGQFKLQDNESVKILFVRKSEI